MLHKQDILERVIFERAIEYSIVKWDDSDDFIAKTLRTLLRLDGGLPNRGVKTQEWDEIPIYAEKIFDEFYTKMKAVE